MSLVGAAAITAGANILGNFFGKKSQDSSNQTNLDINKMNNEFNERMLDKQLAYQTDMFNKSNEWNSAKAQVQRYREAGLNPYLMMTQGAGAGSSQQQTGGLASASGAPGMQAFRPDTSAYQQIGDMIYSKRKQEAEINNIVQDTTSKEIANRTAYQEAMSRLRESYERSESSKQKRWIEREMLSFQRRQMNADFEQTMLKNREIEIASQGQYLDNIAKAIQNENLPSILKLNIAQAAADIARTEKLTEHEAMKIIETQSRYLGIKLDNNIKERSARALVDKARGEAKRANEPQNIWQGISDGMSGFNSFIDHYFAKPSKRMWKDTKRSFGIR